MTIIRKNRLDSYFGEYGGMYVPEILIPALLELEEYFIKSKEDKEFINQLTDLWNNYAGRPTPLTLCKNFSPRKNVKIYLKREDLVHGGAHKTNQVLGQVLLAKKMGKSEVLAETGAGQHGVASALACSLLNIKCRIYMGIKDMKRQELNVFRMKLLGTKVIAVKSGSGTLKDAVNEALRYWSSNYDKSYYLLGTAAGPHPYPTIVRDFQKIIGKETREQIIKKENRLPDKVIACIGGGSNAIGIFHDFINDKDVKLYGIEPAGKGISTNQHGAALSTNKFGILHGTFSAVMQSNDGQINESYSISAGLDYPAVGPEHAHLKKINRVKYYAATDNEAVNAFLRLSKTEGIIPALESSHALAYALKLAKKVNDDKKEQIYIVNLSGRGDKDLTIINNYISKNNIKL